MTPVFAPAPLSSSPAVSDPSEYSGPEQRRDTPTPGWEGGVWFRIRRRRSSRRLGALLLAAVVSSAGLWARRQLLSARTDAPRVSTALQGSRRPDGSAPVPSVWRLEFEGAELRVYRNAMGVVHRCPSAGCTSTPRGGALELPLAAAGEYRALVFSRPVSGGGRTLEEDLSAARARGDAVEMSPPLAAY